MATASVNPTQDQRIENKRNPVTLYAKNSLIVHNTKNITATENKIQAIVIRYFS